jgi:DNA-binding PadR family transcriptional regulator
MAKAEPHLVRTFFLGFIRVHILHHAGEGPIFGLEMIRELARHGYHLSPGTLYPLLHALEKEGFLRVEQQVVEGKVRKYYQATRSGRAALAKALEKARKLLGEIDPARNY